MCRAAVACDVWRCCSTATLGRKNVGSTVHYAHPIVIMTTLESLLREGIKNQRRQLQRYVVARDSRFVCTVCESQQVQHPGWSGPEFNQDNVLGHFKTKHREITIYSHEQFDNARKRVLQVSQPAITTKFPKIEKTTGVDQAVQLMRKLPGTPLSNFDSEDFKRPWADSKGVNSKTVKRAILDADTECFAHLKKRCHGKLVGGQADGGKNVCHEKVIGEAIVIDESFYCWDLEMPPAGTYFDQHYYQDTFEEFVDDIQSCGAIMCGMTMDNEPSLNAGMAAIVRKPEYQHIIHNRCTNHTAELLLEDIKEHIPRLASCVDACHEMVTAIRNNKAFKDALKLCQESTGARPKRLIKPANTRKWSTSFLMLSRMQELYGHITQMEHHFAPTEAPAKRIWLSTWVPRLREAVPADVLRACVEMLYWVYVGEQVLQRDSSSIVHSAHIFERICFIMLNQNVPEIQRISPMLLQGANIAAIQEVVQSRRALVAGNTVYNLCLCMWPITDNQVIDQAEAMNELDAYVSKCWNKWQEQREVCFGETMPIEFRVNNVHDQREMEDKKDAFITAASLQLTTHLLGSSRRIRSAKERFTSNSNAVFQSLTTGLELPIVRRGCILQDRFKLRDYWMLVHCELPALHMVFLCLAAVCATEAGCERIFSKTGFIHCELRNRLNHALVVAMTRNSMNSEDFDGILNGRWIWDFNDALVDIEEVEYDEVNPLL